MGKTLVPLEGAFAPEEARRWIGISSLFGWGCNGGKTPG